MKQKHQKLKTSFEAFLSTLSSKVIEEDVVVFEKLNHYEEKVAFDQLRGISPQILLPSSNPRNSL